MSNPSALLPDAVEITQFALADTSVQQRLRVGYIGVLPGISVLLAHPVQDGKPLFLGGGETVEVRLFSGVDLFQFRSNVLRVCAVPDRYVHIACPLKVARSNLRREARHTASMSATYQIEGVPAQRCRVVDLSLSGARIEVSELTMAVGTTLTLHIEHSEGDVTCPAIVRNRSFTGTVDRIGLEFAGMDSDTRFAVTALLFRLVR